MHPDIILWKRGFWCSQWDAGVGGWGATLRAAGSGPMILQLGRTPNCPEASTVLYPGTAMNWSGAWPGHRAFLKTR